MGTLNQKITQNLVDAWNSGDVARIGALYAPDAVMRHVISPATLRGRKAIVDLEAGMFGAFSDVSWRIEGTVAEGDKLAVEFAVAATHTGPLPTPRGPVAPTGRRIEVCGASILRLTTEGQIAEEHRHVDVAGMMAQLGLA